MGARVLVVDDEPDIRDLLTMLFDDDPRCSNVTAVADLDDTVSTAAALAPDTVILDVMFGHRTCAEILPPLRSMCPDAHIVVFTSSRRAAQSLGVIGLGADVIVQKVTVSFDELIDLALEPPLRLDAAPPVVDPSVDTTRGQ